MSFIGNALGINATQIQQQAQQAADQLTLALEIMIAELAVIGIGVILLLGKTKRG